MSIHLHSDGIVHINWYDFLKIVQFMPDHTLMFYSGYNMIVQSDIDTWASFSKEEKYQELRKALQKGLVF